MTLSDLLEKILTQGWDWPEGDYAWLSSRSGLFRCEEDGGQTAIFFIHGGRIREQARLPHGRFTVEQFSAMCSKRAVGLDTATVCWESDTGAGDSGLWVEGTRLPTEDDMKRLLIAQQSIRDEDERTLHQIAIRRAVFQNEELPIIHSTQMDEK